MPPAASPGTPVLRAVVRRQRRSLALASALFVSHQIGEISVPVVAGALIDRAIVTADGDALVRWLFALVVVFAVLSTSWRWADRIMTRSLEAGALDLRLGLTARVTDPGGLAGPWQTGQILSIASSDATGAAGVQRGVAAAVAGSAALVVAAAVLLAISVPLGLVVIVGLPPVLFLVQLLAAPIERRFAVQQHDVARAAATATDLIGGIRVLKGLRAEAEASTRYRRASRRSLAAGLRASRLYAAHGGLTVATTGVFVALVALVGGRLAADGSVSVGELVAAVGVTQFLVGPIGRLGFAAAALATARASASRIAAVLHAPALVADGTGSPLTVPAGALDLRAVTYQQLEHFDLHVEPGRLLALAVADQADAVALMDLLSRHADPARGTVELDGTPFEKFALDELRRNVLVDRHDAPLFSGSVLDNVTTAAPALAADSEELAAVLASAAADEVVAALPDGLAAVLTERGASLSGGQRQRVALARALAADSPVLVLHEPTTAVDAVTEARIAAGLRTRRTGRTTVVVTSSPALLAVADRVVLVDRGRVADAGTHDELVARNPRYIEVVLT